MNYRNKKEEEKTFKPVMLVRDNQVIKEKKKLITNENRGPVQLGSMENHT